MKEYLSNIDAEDYHSVVYPSIVNGDNVFQATLDGDLLVVFNPEKHQPTQEITPKEVKPARHPLQAEFILVKPWSNKL